MTQSPTSPKRSRRMCTPPTLETLLLGPPELHLIGNDGSLVTEPLTLVATIDAPDSARAELALYGICMDHAHFERDNSAQGGRWIRCLLSVPSLEVLRELREQGEFPYPLEAGPSEAEARWQLAQARGARTRERLPLSLYVEPASIASRDALKRLLH